MRRLVYSPRAYAFIKDQSGTIHNVSADITAGSVTRKIDQVSSATVTLRNPDMKYTAHRIRGKNEIALPVFHPMDPITIYLRRLSGHPVRVFTGFLDRTPYLQLFPGTVTLQASCTLKRLLYTYFDPALPYTQSFLREYGWLEMENGVWGSFAALDQYKRPGSPASASSIQGRANGSISELLYATLKHIGHWNHESVYIEKLPDGLYERLTELAQEFQVDSELSKQSFENILKQIVGSSSHGGGGGDTNLGSVGQVTGGLTTEHLKNAAGIANDAGAASSIHPAILMSIYEVETSSGANVNTSSAGAQGPMQFMPSTWQSYGNGGDINNLHDSMFAAARYLKANGGMENLRKAIFAYNHADWYVNKVLNVAKKYGYPPTGGNSGSDSTTGMRDSGVSNNTDQPTTRSPTKGGSNKSNKTANDDKWAYPLGKDAGNGAGGVASHMSRALGNWQSDNAVDLMVPAGTPWIAVEDGVISSTLGWGDSAGSGVDTVYGYRLHLEGASGNTYFYQHGAKNIAARGKDVKKGEIIGEVGDWSSNGIPNHLHFAAKPPTNPEDVVAGGAVTAGTGGTSGDAGQSSSPGGAAALFGTLNLPGALDTIAANMLSGEKSLMNDKPLMPFVQQLCNAGLRHFQSMPDGKFYAFYPDYFGELYQHEPYWNIDNIEIINGGIDLDDTALVTHTYVVGDTASPTIGATAPFWLRAVFSAGVVTIYNAFLAGDVLDRDKTRSKNADKVQDAKDPPAGMGIALDRAEANSFLERYGARPNVDQDEPLIKSNFYEMFLAYQRFMLGWSRQFLSQFTFTFMPEIYPGGKVGFPEHDLQMYVEEVSHSWDYTSGFLTQASLSAPSVYVNKEGVKSRGLLPSNMVKAIIEPVSQSRVRVKDKPVTIPAPSLNSGSTPGVIRDSGPANNK